MYVFINRTRFLAILIKYYALTKVPPQNNHIKYKKYRLISLGNNKPEYETPFRIICAKASAASPIIRNPINLRTYPSSPTLRDSVGRYAVGVPYPPQDLREDLPEPLRSLNREDITDARVQRRNRHSELGVGKVENLCEDGGEKIAPRLLGSFQRCVNITAAKDVNLT